MKYAIIFLASCSTQLRVSSVDDESQPYYDNITSNLSVLGYPDLVRIDPNGIAIVTDTQAVLERNAIHPSKAFYSQSHNRIVIPKAGDLEHTDKAIVLLMLAHEMGHALGLQHTDHGLMKPDGFPPECFGSNAAVCLIEALNERH